MAGHSQFKNIMYRKGAQDKKRAKVFTKIIRELTTAARTGLPDPAPIRACAPRSSRRKQANMPKDTVERAIKRGAGGDDGENYDEVRYEGYGPGGVAVIVEALTDNRNRTASDVRAAFTKAGGNLGESNSVSFLFDRRRPGDLSRRGGGRPRRCSRRRSRPAPTMSRAAPRSMSSPARPRSSTRCATRSRRASAPPPSAQARLEAEDAGRRSTATTREALFKLLETLEDSDDVQNVFANFEVSDDVMARLSA